FENPKKQFARTIATVIRTELNRNSVYAGVARNPLYSPCSIHPQSRRQISWIGQYAQFQTRFIHFQRILIESADIGLRQLCSGKAKSLPHHNLKIAFDSYPLSSR